ncbi:MAG: hypothetical protein EZS28_035405 [Streblomastix strix]|uniref:Uncharacterized protein n=1 Tax=Streblomastix strix TaxID=222440 RepID=A0A5J4UF66_9EUKA|nr:MAG: hypothetical protein EZS28_035405 [Streblomastix strix]
MALGTAQTINANKAFNNVCRFTSAINGIASITGASFIKSGADDTVVLLGAGGTKPISEFSSSVDDSNYIKKDGEVQQDIQGILRKTILDQPYPEPTDDDYITLEAVKSEFVSSIYSGSINGNLTANQFIKSGGTDQQVLLANGTTQAISEFGSGGGDMSIYVLKTGQSLQVIKGYIRKSMQDVEDYPSEEDEDYITKGEVARQYTPSGTNQQVFLANGDIKPLSEFAGGSVDDSNYVKKTGQITQSIEGKLIRSGSMESFNGASISEYLTKDLIVGGCVLTYGGGNVSGNIEASGNITSASFVKSDGTNQQVLLANGTTKPLSEFSGGGGDMSNYVQKIGQTLQVINGKLRKGDGEEDSEFEEEDNITQGQFANNTNNIINTNCVRKVGQNTQSVRGRLLYINPFGIEEDDSQDLTDTTYPTWREVSNAVTSKFYNIYQVLTPPIMLSGFTASQSSFIKINNQMYFFYLVVKPDDTIQASQGRDICTFNPPPLYTLFCPMNSDYLVMLTTDGYVHFTTQSTVCTQNSNVAISTFWVRP